MFFFLNSVTVEPAEGLPSPGDSGTLQQSSSELMVHYTAL